MFFESEREFFTKTEACELLRIGKTTLERWVRVGKIKQIKTGGGRSCKVLFAKSEIDKIINS